MKKRVFSILLVLVFTFACIGCGTSSESSSKTKDGLTKITIASPTPLESFDHMVMYVAQEMGYFKEEGLEVTIKDGTGNDTKMVASNQAQFAYPSPGVTLAGKEAGLDVQAVCNWDTVNIFGFAVKSDSSIKSWADLKGKSIALGDAAWQPIAEPILAKAGIDTKDVNWVVMGDSRFQAVETGKCDAVLTWLCEYGQLVGQGYDLKYFDGNEQIPQLSNGLVTSSAYAKKNPKIVKKMTKAFLKAEYFCYCNSDAAADIVLKKCPNLEIDKKGAQSAAEYCVKSYFGINEEDQKKYIESGMGMYTDKLWQYAIDASLDSGTIKKEVKPSEIYTNKYVDNSFDKSSVEKDADNYKFQSKVFK